MQKENTRTNVAATYNACEAVLAAKWFELKENNELGAQRMMPVDIRGILRDARSKTKFAWAEIADFKEPIEANMKAWQAEHQSLTQELESATEERKAEINPRLEELKNLFAEADKQLQDFIFADMDLPENMPKIPASWIKGKYEIQEQPGHAVFMGAFWDNLIDYDK